VKILHVIPFFTPSRGGSVAVPYEQSKMLSIMGHDVTIITTDFEFDKEYAKSIENEGVEVIPFHCIANMGLFLFSPSMKKWLKDNIEKFDLAHMHNFRSYQNNVVYHYAKKYRVPYIIQAHGSLPRIFGKKQLKKIYDHVWGNKLLNGAEGVIAVTNMEIEQYQNMGLDRDKIQIVPNGIDLSKYDQIPKKGEFRRKYSIKDDGKIILYLGRIHRIKGIDLLVDAFADVINEVDNVKLVVVGPDDGFLSMLKKQIANLKIDDKILFTGPLYEKDKLEAYVDADVCVLPSRYETFPVCALEACACSVPVIVTDNCGIANLVGDKVGCVVEFDKSQLRDAMFKILSDEKLRRKFRENGRKLVEERFDWGKIIDRVVKVYSALKNG